MVFVTGDTHGDIDISKLNTRRFPEQKSMSKADSLIICGDFGGVWDGGKPDLYLQKWYASKTFTTMFVDGNHENHEMLNSFPEIDYKGGKAHKINYSLYHLMRGNVFEIEGLKIFCMGGASSADKWARVEGRSWWREELPSVKECQHAMESLDLADWDVDIIVTHCAPSSILKEINSSYIEDTATKFLQVIEDQCRFKHWYFGHYHIDREIDDKHTAIYQKVTRIL